MEPYKAFYIRANLFYTSMCYCYCYRFALH